MSRPAAPKANTEALLRGGSPVSRIAATFEALQAQGRKALIPYVTAGFPYADITPALMHGMVAAGADVIELGVPFSDPMADGPVIQQAGEAALALGVGMKQVLAMVAAFREQDQATPVVYSRPATHTANTRTAFIPFLLLVVVVRCFSAGTARASASPCRSPRGARGRAAPRSGRRR